MIIGTSGNDVIVGTAGDDLIRGLAGNDLICARAGQDTVFGGRGRDVIRGGEGRDRLIGGGGPDTVYGGPAADVLRGGPGNDELIGGAGRDRCRDPQATFSCERVNGIVVVPAVSTNSQNIDATVSTALWTAEIEREIRRLVNVERAVASVDRLTMNAGLNSGSRNWSSYLATSGNFNHDPNLEWHVGENIAQNYWLGQRTIRNARIHASQLMAQWMNSPGHRQNILRTSYYRLGVGVIMQGNLSYATQRFSIIE